MTDGPSTKRPVRTPGNPRGLRDLPFELPRVDQSEKRRAARLAKALESHYPGAVCELDFGAPHELLVATILSAQSTDAGVNKVTPALFEAFPTPADYADASPSEIEPYIRTLGLYRNKARAVREAMATLVEAHGGEVPRDVASLLRLRGVARKTAGVVLGNCFGINDVFVVDTHIHRLARRFCLIEEGDNAQRAERKLMALFPRSKWCELSHRFIWHGRRACTARGGTCGEHPICRSFGSCCEKRDGDRSLAARG